MSGLCIKHKTKEHLMGLLTDLYNFYRYDCCWPYAVSFPLTAVIYWLDFAPGYTGARWASFISYSIIFAYYLRNTRLYKDNRLKSHNHDFFIGFLSFKIIVLGSVLLLLYARAMRR